MITLRFSQSCSFCWPQWFCCCGVSYQRHHAAYTISAVSILVLGGAALLIAGQPQPAEQLFNGAFVNDSFARFMKILTLAGAAFAILLSFDYLRRERLLRFEYPVLILMSAAGMMLTISANDLISLYLALEFQSWRFMCWPRSAATACARRRPALNISC